MTRQSESLITIETAEDAYALRQIGRAAAAAVGVHASDQIRLATALSELGREVVNHGGKAQAQFRFSSDGWLEVSINGIPRLACEPHAFNAIDSAKRLIDAVEVTPSSEGVNVSLRLHTATLTASAKELNRAIVASATRRPLEELRLENRELIATLAEIREKQDELVRLNAELEETNRGVMAMYNQLSDELDETNRGVVALYGELDDKTQQLKGANEAKSRFLASVSHELRSPVSSIVGLVKLLLEPVDDSENSADQQRQLRYIESSARDLLKLVNELLDLSKAESGKIEPDVEVFELQDLFSELHGSLRPLVPQGVKLVVERCPKDARIESDRTLLAQILRNLLTNALKFTEHGKVWLTCTNVDGYAFELRVGDTGIGISPEDQGRIFEEFFQVKNPLQTKAKGTGLGLPYVRRLTDILGGTMTLQSKPGDGTMFTIRLTRSWRPVSARLPGTQPAMDNAVVGSALIVDDDPAFRAVLRGMVQGHVTQVFEAAGGVEALQIMREVIPDLVFLDLRMPDMAGADVLSEMKRDPALRDVAVIIVSSEDLGLGDRFDPTPFLAKASLSRDAVAAAVAKAVREKTLS